MIVINGQGHLFRWYCIRKEFLIGPSYISSSSCAGVAAAAGELAKDYRHQDVVEEAGCNFIQPVVEPLGCGHPLLFVCCKQLLILPQELLLSWLDKTYFSSFLFVCR